MKWIIWNVRGINKLYKKKELKNYLKTKNIKLVGIIEARVKENKARENSQHIAPGWEMINNYNAAVNGRIWVKYGLLTTITVKLIKAEAQVLHCTVTNAMRDEEYAISIVYGYNTVEQRRQLWDNLKAIDQMTTIPWIIGGDFNDVLQLQDRKHGNPVTRAETQDFSNRIQELKLNELNWEGDYYTWSNKQKMQNVWMKLKDLRTVLKKINVEEFKFIKKNIELGRIELEHVQKIIDADSNYDQLRKEKELMQNLEKWKSNQRKQIVELQVIGGNKITDAESIQKEIVDFYKSLMGTTSQTLPAIDKTVMCNGDKLTQQQRIKLCKDVTTEKNYEGLCSIGEDKAPGVDGYNVVFFKRTWPIVKNEVMEAVMDFFQVWKAVSKPKTVKEFKHSAFCTVLYKMISKVLAARLQGVMGTVINEAQAGFIHGRR
ncbi:PREDICTED: uncharacterized protein LOC109229979 [Nicotiana attenuata]|uniref:uncharacterized protein LOC109229979 n=1 Tax=Nicotiana attenuata TaxID=49451 RepID=UPI000904B50B|nr:PREDICTED: uncharacterized protein LOC109229979 [Nicotiana attenuata]